MRADTGKYTILLQGSEGIAKGTVRMRQLRVHESEACTAVKCRVDLKGIDSVGLKKPASEKKRRQGVTGRNVILKATVP